MGGVRKGQGQGAAGEMRGEGGEEGKGVMWRMVVWEGRRGSVGRD